MRLLQRLVIATILILPGTVIIAAEQQAPSAPEIPLDDSVTTAQVRTLLQSSLPREQAWGAALAVRKNLKDLNPLLEVIASQNLGGRTIEEQVALDNALDALIWNDAHSSPDFLQTIYDRRPGAALVLLAKIGPAADPVLLKIVANPPTSRPADWGVWCAAANLLSQHHAPGFVPKLFPLLTTTGFLDTGNVQGPRGVQAPFFFADGVLGSPNTNGLPGWPGFQVLADSSNVFAGPVAVGISRQNGPANSLGKRVGLPQPEVSFNYLASLTRLTTMPVHAMEYRKIPANLTPVQYTAESRRFEEDIRQRYALLVRSLQTSGFLTADEAAKLPEPNISVQ